MKNTLWLQWGSNLYIISHIFSVWPLNLFDALLENLTNKLNSKFAQIHFSKVNFVFLGNKIYILGNFTNYELIIKDNVAFGSTFHSRFNVKTIMFDQVINLKLSGTGRLCS